MRVLADTSRVSEPPPIGGDAIGLVPVIDMVKWACICACGVGLQVGQDGKKHVCSEGEGRRWGCH